MLAVQRPDVDETDRRATQPPAHSHRCSDLCIATNVRTPPSHRVDLLSSWSLVEPHTLIIACVIHGAEELKIENHPEPCPQDGEVLVGFGVRGICGSHLHYYNEGGILEFLSATREQTWIFVKLVIFSRRKIYAEFLLKNARAEHPNQSGIPGNPIRIRHHRNLVKHGDNLLLVVKRDRGEDRAAQGILYHLMETFLKRTLFRPYSRKVLSTLIAR